MPIQNYGVLKGTATDKDRGGGSTPHYEILIDAGKKRHRIAVNVKSQEAPSEVLYFVDESFDWTQLQRLQNLSPGFKALHPQDPIAIDYVRTRLFDTTAMKPLPGNLSGSDNDLEDLVDKYITRAINTPGALVWAFGQKFGPENGKDQTFGFSPEQGIHDIHMNQGNVGSFVKDDGVFQDGALLIHLPKNDQWIAIFLAFQSQSFQTDNHTGHRLAPATKKAGASSDGGSSTHKKHHKH